MREWLKERREACGFTTKQMAERCFTPESYYMDIEAGKKRLPPLIIGQLSAIFRLDPVEIFKDELRREFKNERQN